MILNDSRRHFSAKVALSSGILRAPCPNPTDTPGPVPVEQTADSLVEEGVPRYSRKHTHECQDGTDEAE